MLLILPPRCVQVVQCLGSLPFTQSTLNPLPWSLHSRLCTCPGVSMSRCPVKLGQSPALPVKNALDCLSAPSGYDLAKTWPTVPCTAPSRTGLAHVQPNTGQLGRVGPPRALSRSGLAKTWQSWASQSPFTLWFGQNLANMPSTTPSCSGLAKTWQSWAYQSSFTLRFGQNLAELGLPEPFHALLWPELGKYALRNLLML